jgi:hypothetical protein
VEQAMIPITIIRDCLAMKPKDYELDKDSAKCGVKLTDGTIAEYIGHVIGGNIRIRLRGGEELIVHPATTDCK